MLTSHEFRAILIGEKLAGRDTPPKIAGTRRGGALDLGPAAPLRGVTERSLGIEGTFPTIWRH